MRSMMSSAKGRLLILGLFGLVVAVGTLGVLSQTQLFSGKLYHVTAPLEDADNLVAGSQVRIAGVPVGNVLDIRVVPGAATVTLGLNGRYAPLHEGVTLRVGNRSLVEETYVDVTDGPGAPIPDGGALPAASVRPSTQLRDILDSLDPTTRAALSSTVRSAGTATDGTHEQVGQLFDGLDSTGGAGGDALEAIAAQGEDLRRLTRHTAVLLRTLDTGQGDLSALVESGNRLTEATARERPAIEDTMVRLPGVLDSARNASAGLTDLSGSLKPVAAALAEASPGLRDAMHDLPGTTRDLRALMPDLDTALDRAPPALDRVHGLSDDLRDDLIPNTRDILRDANPMLMYLKDYAPEVAGLVSNFNETIGYTDEAGRETFHVMVTGVDTAAGSPVNPGSIGRFNAFNPIPPSGRLRDPGPFTGTFPRVERQPR
jgi:phospholipid/cholesterol/gamma-HCH transport system substrate-binding protein